MRKTLAALALALLAALPSHALNRSCHGDSLRWAGDKRAHLDLLIREYKALRERQARKAPDKRAKRAAR